MALLPTPPNEEFDDNTAIIRNAACPLAASAAAMATEIKLLQSKLARLQTSASERKTTTLNTRGVDAASSSSESDVESLDDDVEVVDVDISRRSSSIALDLPLPIAPQYDELVRSRGIKEAIAFPAANDDFRAARTRAADACATFNATRDSADPQLRAQRWWDIVKPGYVPPATEITLPGQPSPLANAPYVKPPVYVDYGLRLHVGRGTFINRNFTVLDTPVQDIHIGERCHFGPHVSIYCVSHPMHADQRLGLLPYPANDNDDDDTQAHRMGKCGPSLGTGVVIGDCVWIGGNVTILGGVRIGDGAVIAAGSSVTSDIPPFHFAEGSPARVVRRISLRTRPVRWADTLEDALASNASS